MYLQDDWRTTSRLTLNLGIRWDYVSGMPIDQDTNPNFVALQAAGRTGRFAGTALEDFGKTPASDKNNIQPRIGFAYDLRGDGRDVIRGGWGIYTDFAYTGANALFPTIDAAGGSGFVFVAVNPAGLRKPDGTLFRASEPLSAIASLNTVNPNVPPLAGVVLSPRIEQPYTYQSNLGWGHRARRRERGDRGLRGRRRPRPQHPPAAEHAGQRPPLSRGPPHSAERIGVPDRDQQGREPVRCA